MEEAFLKKLQQLEKMGWISINKRIIKQAVSQSLLDTFKEASYGEVQRFLKSLIP